METGLKDKVVLITGASGGIGRACAEAFAAEGARLVLHANSNPDEAERLKSELGVKALVVEGDVTEKQAVKHFFSEAIEYFGRLDVVVANAGVWPPKNKPIHKLNLKRWNNTIAVNLTGVFLCAREYFRYLDRETPENASLVMVSSTAGVFGEADHADYAASKAALAYGLTKSLKNEIVRLVPDGRVNTVCPGWTLTRMAEDELRASDDVVPILQTRSLRKIARAEDIANTIVFLASDRLAGHITGEAITVAGGMEGRLLHQPKDIDTSQA